MNYLCASHSQNFLVNDTLPRTWPSHTLKTMPLMYGHKTNCLTGRVHQYLFQRGSWCLASAQIGQRVAETKLGSGSPDKFDHVADFR